VTDECIASDVFDRLRKATAKNPAELGELCRDYLTEARRTLTSLRTAMLHGQADQLSYQAHYLKGSSLILGATAVTRYCAALEEMGRKHDFEGTEQLLEQVASALDSVEAEMTRKLGDVAPPAEGSAA
jgi:HPt (histidine-containing phosphotransfer) domain-containing protein